MRFAIIMKDGAPEKWPTAVLKQGMRRLGLSEIGEEYLRPCDILITWTPWAGSRRERAMLAHQARKGRVLVGENGYFSPDGARRWTLGINGTNGRGQHLPADGDRQRRDALGLPLSPWSGGGDYVLVLGQRGVKTNTPAISHGPEWPDQIVGDIARLAPDVPIRFRPHPGRCEAFPRTQEARERVRVTDPREPLADALAGARLAVGYCTTALVEAAWRGVPCVYTARQAIVAPVADSDLTHALAYVPRRPDRESWADRIASWQWTDDELASGEPMRALIA